MEIEFVKGPDIEVKNERSHEDYQISIIEDKEVPAFDVKEENLCEEIEDNGFSNSEEFVVDNFCPSLPEFHIPLTSIVLYRSYYVCSTCDFFCESKYQLKRHKTQKHPTADKVKVLAI